jgi:hypothetical protein
VLFHPIGLTCSIIICSSNFSDDPLGLALESGKFTYLNHFYIWTNTNSKFEDLLEGFYSSIHLLLR